MIRFDVDRARGTVTISMEDFEDFAEALENARIKSPRMAQLSDDAQQLIEEVNDRC